MKTVRSFALSIAGAALLATVPAAVAHAAANPSNCLNDIDCVASPACGGDVCDYPALTCQPANAAAQGGDGWCTHDSDCKCYAEGATCAGTYCTFTVPKSSAGGAGGHSATGGGPGTTGAGGQAAAGGSAGTTGGSTGTTGAAGASSNGGSSSGGGCSVAGREPAPLASLLLLSCLGIAVARRRRG